MTEGTHGRSGGMAAGETEHAGHGPHADHHSGEREPDGHVAHGDGAGHAAHAGHGGHAGHGDHGDHAAMFRDKFWLTVALAIPVVAFSSMFQDLIGYEISFPGSNWIAPVLGTVVFFYGGWPFLTGAIGEVRSRKPGMMLLIGMAITVAFVASLANAVGIFAVEVWWELALLIAIMLLGHWMEMRAIGQAGGALAALAALLPDAAELIEGDGVRVVPAAELAVDDVVLVRPGARVPADGLIVEGAADLDESMLTGESRPVPRTVGDRVVAGAVAVDSAIRVTVTAVGDDTALAGISRLVDEAQQSRSHSQVLADRAAALLFYVAVTAALVTAVTWSLVGRPDQAVILAVTVLIIACPHALGLAIPLVTAISTSLSARNGILVKDRLALEKMRAVDVVLFDKTGTLTRGRHRVTGAAAVDGDTDRLLIAAAAAESDSEHPVARAIVAAAAERGTVPAASGFAALPGRGVQATVGGVSVAVGGPGLLRDRALSVPASLQDRVGGWQHRGASVLYVIEDGAVTGAVGLEDEIRPESRHAIDTLHRQGIRTAMITGDAQQVADAVAADLGIDEVFAEVLPADKDRAVAGLQARGHIVAMVGDGVNDAPALARADVGIAIGAGTDVAIESAGIVLASSNPQSVAAVRTLSKRTYRKMLQNLWWAAGYNIIAIPLAAGALAWAGITLPMAVGAVLMSLSTIVVALNAQLLRRTDLGVASAA